MTAEPLTPDALRRAAREAPYLNQQTEREVLARVDAAANAVVSRHEKLLMEESQNRLEDGRALLRVSEELESALLTDVRGPLRDGAAPDHDLATQYSRLKQDFETAIEELEMQARRAETIAARLEDPAADYERFAERFPVQKKSINW